MPPSGATRSAAGSGPEPEVRTSQRVHGHICLSLSSACSASKRRLFVSDLSSASAAVTASLQIARLSHADGPRPRAQGRSPLFNPSHRPGAHAFPIAFHVAHARAAACVAFCLWLLEGATRLVLRKALWASHEPNPRLGDLRPIPSAPEMRSSPRKHPGAQRSSIEHWSLWPRGGGGSTSGGAASALDRALVWVRCATSAPTARLG